jgi:DNA-binding LacI/PurR family transcriptional regulator
VAGNNAPTMQDVAARAGVSRSLVSLVMQGSSNVSPHRREAVLRAAAELGYRPNAHARNLARRTTRSVGVMLSDLHNPFFAEIYDGVEAEATEAGYRLLVNTGSRRPTGERAALETLLELRVDGIILTGARLAAADIAAAAREVPVTLVTRVVRDPSVDWVTSDDTHGAELAVTHLAALGHRRIAHVDGGRGAGAAARRRGYQQAMARLGLDRYVQVVHGDFTEASGVAAARRLVRSVERPSAIFAANDLCALGVLSELDELGLSVPGDMSVVGYDNTALAALHSVNLTTIDQPRLAMGRQAMHAVLARISGESNGTPMRSVLAPTLVVRETTGPPPGQEPSEEEESPRPAPREQAPRGQAPLEQEPQGQVRGSTP